MDKIYDEYYYKIYYWAIKKTRNKEDAEDLTNNIFVSRFEYLGKNIQIDKLDNLIWKIAYNCWCTKAKKYIKEKNNVSMDTNYDVSYQDDMLDKVIYREIIDEINDFNLTEKEIIVFKMYYCEDLSVKEISQKINTSESNIKYYLYNARKKIKERYND